MKAISLFSGCCGLDIGLKLSGIKTILCVESDKTCRETIGLNWPHIPVFGDVCELDRPAVYSLIGNSKVDVVVGGPPCQSFSTMGKRGSMADKRGKLLLEYLRILNEVSPDFFIMENVRGILSACIDGRPLVPWIMSKVKRMGYHARWYKLNAVQFGSAQERLRVIVMGAKHGRLPKSFPEAPRKKTLGEEIRDLEGAPGECGKFSPKMASFLAKVPEGGNWKSLKEEDWRKAMGNANLSSGGFTGCYRRLSYERPAPTLLTSPTQRATTLCHPCRLRPLSISEYRRIQGFPDDWELAGSTAQKYRQLGNAVPVRMAEALGRALTQIRRKQ